MISKKKEIILRINKKGAMKYRIRIHIPFKNKIATQIIENQIHQALPKKITFQKLKTTLNQMFQAFIIPIIVL